MKFKLSDISSMKYGSLPKHKSVDGQYPIFTGYKTSGYSDEFNVEDPEIVVVARGVGGTGDVKMAPGPAWITNLSIILRVNPDLVNKKYLQLKLAGMGLRYLDSGSAQSQITIKDLSEVKIDLPDLDVQTKVAKTIQMFEDKISNLQAINDNLLELAQQIFVGKYLSKQDSFPMTTLSEIVGVKTGTFNPKKSNDNDVAHFSLPAFDSGSVPTVDLVDSIKSNKNIITQYTVLASKMNPTTKRVWIPNYVQGMTNVASTEFLTFNASDEYQQAFIWAVVDSEEYQNHLISGATGSTGSRQRIKPGDAYSFEVGYDPDEAHRIGMILNPLLQKVKNNRDEIVTLVQLRDNLLTNLLN